MNKVILNFEYDNEDKCMIEPALESFVGSCISYAQDIELKKLSENTRSENSCDGCPLE